MMYEDNNYIKRLNTIISTNNLENLGFNIENKHLILETKFLKENLNNKIRFILNIELKNNKKTKYKHYLNLLLPKTLKNKNLDNDVIENIINKCITKPFIQLNIVLNVPFRFPLGTRQGIYYNLINIYTNIKTLEMNLFNIINENIIFHNESNNETALNSYKIENLKLELNIKILISKLLEILEINLIE